MIRVSTSPLSKIPNAGLGAAYSRLAWAFPREYRGLVTIDLPKIHEKLGRDIIVLQAFLALVLKNGKDLWCASDQMKSPTTLVRHMRLFIKLEASFAKIQGFTANLSKEAIRHSSR
jgi:hypothetical protein